jgi:hypothetical protein
MPPPFICTFAAPELHRPLQHRLHPAATPSDLLMVVVDSSPAPWTSSPLERGGGGEGGCRDHMASQAATLPPARRLLHPDHVCRRWHHGRQDPERCSGVIVSVLQRLPRRLRHPRGWPPHRRQSFRARPLPRMAATTARRLGEQSRPLGLLGYPLIHCHRLCQPHVIDGPRSDRLRCEEGGEGSY